MLIGSWASIDKLHCSSGRAVVAEKDPSIPVIVISAGTCGQASGANDLIRVAKRELLAGLADRVRLRITGCHGYCQMEPSVLVEPRGHLLPEGQARGRWPRIVEAVAQGEVVEDLLFVDPATGERDRAPGRPPVLRQPGAHASSRATRRSIRSGSTTTSSTAATRRSPSVLEQRRPRVGDRRGQGVGAARPRRRRLPDRREVGAARQAAERPRQVPRLQRRRGRPRRLHGPQRARGQPAQRSSRGCSSAPSPPAPTEGVVYVRNEYPLAIKHLIIALRQARELGLLGEDILGTGFSFDIDARARRRRLRLRRGDGADALDRGQDGRAAPAPAVPGAARHRRQARPRSTTSRPGPTSRSSSPTGAEAFAARRHAEATPAPRSSAWSARSRTPAWSRCRWASRSPRSSTTSAAAPLGQGADQGGADRRPVGRLHPGLACSTCRSTTTA